jgi:predicted DNA-binding protein (UPF0251 family)
MISGSRVRGVNYLGSSASKVARAAAKKLGISRRTLHRKINEMNLAKKSPEAANPASSDTR